MIGKAIYVTGGFGIAAFAVALFIFHRQAKAGNRDNLISDSVLVTSIMAGLLVWVASALLVVVI